MKIVQAKQSDIFGIMKLDAHIDEKMMMKKIIDNQVIVMKVNDDIVGTLRYGMFWDEIAFLNLLFIKEDFRGQGIGSSLLKYWESLMKELGFEFVLTSTLVTESAQYFYRNLGYSDCGSLLLKDEPTEIFMVKSICHI